MLSARELTQATIQEISLATIFTVANHDKIVSASVVQGPLFSEVEQNPGHKYRGSILLQVEQPNLLDSKLAKLQKG